MDEDHTWSKGDRSWMQRRVENYRVTDEFMYNVNKFLDFAYSLPRIVDDNNTIRCPFLVCKNKKWISRDEVNVHLFKKGFLTNYKWWTLYGEGEEWLGETSNDRRVDIGDSSNRYVDMIMEAASTDFNWDEESQLLEKPNSDAKRFFKLLQNADEELWEGCSWHTWLSVVTQLLNCKSEFNMSENCYDRIVSVVKVSVGADLDIPGVLLGDGPMEEVNLNDIAVPRSLDDDQLDEEEYAEDDEWEDDDEDDNIELDVDNEEVGFEYESITRTGVSSIDQRTLRGTAHLEPPLVDSSDRQLIKAISDEKPTRA
ncbi:Transposon, En/Spm-like protein [Quillaja saponaria]|uniref:Transposon, En/Spm-like protein n=1 Tax=Quillaja saponaria TaxID=32244 RepID=A0AAD7Q860_QUISA|nr:Transposon, En/Spm-like protein [Quillaja saponaria]